MDQQRGVLPKKRQDVLVFHMGQCVGHEVQALLNYTLVLT
jgi:hypothetical protein